MDLQTIWFILIAVLFTGYVLLDGFDLGVGILHLTSKSETERRAGINSIAPVWDGNEVWLLTAGGALFAAFPPVYAAVGSGFYVAVVLLLLGLIFRAVSLEFRGKVDSPVWRSVADYCFSIGSVVVALLLGVAFGNVARGIPLDGNGMYVGTFLALLNPFAVLVGIAAVALLAAHGAAWLIIKTEGDLPSRLWRLVPRLWAVFLITLVILTGWAAIGYPHLFSARSTALFFVFVVLLLGALAFVSRGISVQAAGKLFAGTALTIVSLLSLTALNLYPVMLRSFSDGNTSLTIRNASSSAYTLDAMLTIALIGVPLVLLYTVAVYWVFKGKAQGGDTHY